ncbi:MAG: tyrosine-type recombinase/integrase [Propionibacteriaceae bacterium]|nr:tyrosine-type recombinase/integrase [Propionibacteriaceae bacterium]
MTRTCATLTEAREWVAAVRSDVARGVFLAPNAETFDALAGRWLASRRDIRERTRLGYQQVLKPVRARIGHRKAQSLHRADVEELVSWLATEGGQRGKGLAQRSIVYTLGAVSQVLAYGVAEGLLSSNPAAGVKPPRKTRADEREVAVWEPADLLAFRKVADADEWAAGWRLTLSGLRRSEVMGMRWPSVDLTAGTVRVEAGRVLLDGHRTATDDPKSAASWRTVDVESMHPGTVTLLRSLKARQAADRLAAGAAYEESGYVLVDALGRPVRPEAYSDRFTELCTTAGVPRIRMHDVRHTLGLTMHRAGQAPADVAALLGHTLGTHLGVYVPRTERGAITAAHALGEVLAAAQ